MQMLLLLINRKKELSNHDEIQGLPLDATQAEIKRELTKLGFEVKQNSVFEIRLVKLSVLR